MATSESKPDHLSPTPLCNSNKFSNSENPPNNIELEDKEQGFIGPRLPRMMTDEEFKAFCQRLLGYKNDREGKSV